MKQWMRRARFAGFPVGVLTAVLLLAPGCDDGGGGNGSNSTTSATSPAGTNATATGAVTDPNFPDGLHPSSAANDVIASAFAAHISGSPSGIGDNAPNTVVCLGDSITSAGYPGSLAAMTGKTAIDEGKPGEESGSGAARAGAVLSRYHPAYLCILYGANDAIAHVPAPTVAANIQSIVEAARNQNTIPIVATLTPMSGHYAQFQADAQAVSAEIRAMASRTSTPLADLASEF